MVTMREVELTRLVSTQLGLHAALISGMEPMIDESIMIVSRQQEEEQTENSSIPVMMDLLKAAKDLVNAHKVIVRMAEMMMTGGMHHQGSDSVQ